MHIGAFGADFTLVGQWFSTLFLPSEDVSAYNHWQPACFSEPFSQSMDKQVFLAGGQWNKPSLERYCDTEKSRAGVCGDSRMAPRGC